MTPEEIKAAEDAQDSLAGTVPDEVVGALLPASLRIGGRPVHPITVTDYLLLKKLNSPLAQAGKTFADCEDEDVLRLCYLVTHTPAECVELLDGGVEDFDAAAMEFGAQIELAQLKSVGEAIGRLIYQATAMGIPTAPPDGSGKKKSSKRTPGTGSAGR